MEDARRSGVAVLPELVDFVSTAMLTEPTATDTSTTRVIATMVGATGRKQRAQRALRMLCEARGATTGYLFLVRAWI